MMQFIYKSSILDLNLPVNVIYFFGKKEDDNFNEPFQKIMEVPFTDQQEITKIQEFSFLLNYVSQEDLEPGKFFGEKYEQLSDDWKKFYSQAIRDVFPSDDGGCFMVRLLPDKNQQEDASDCYLVGYPDKDATPEDALRDFARQAALDNHEQRFGSAYSEEPNVLPGVIAEDREPSLPIVRFSTRSSNDGMLHSMTTRDMYQAFFVKDPKLQKKAMSEFKKLMSNGTNEAILEYAKQMIASIELGATFSPDKCCLKIERDGHGDGYDVNFYPNGIEEEYVTIPFERVQTKIWYIFFLRHPEGINLTQLRTYVEIPKSLDKEILKRMKEYYDELISLFRKFGKKSLDLDDLILNQINSTNSYIRRDFVDALKELGIYEKSVAKQFSIESAPRKGEKRNTGFTFRIDFCSKYPHQVDLGKFAKRF